MEKRISKLTKQSKSHFKGNWTNMSLMEIDSTGQDVKSLEHSTLKVIEIV